MEKWIMDAARELLGVALYMRENDSHYPQSEELAGFMAIIEKHHSKGGCMTYVREKGQTYSIWLADESNWGWAITCNDCGMTSYNFNDIAQKYCPNCHQFHAMKVVEMGKTSEWQDEIVEAEKSMSNSDLLKEVIQLAGGDDYDGEFTARGGWKFQYLRARLYGRLADWLQKGD